MSNWEPPTDTVGGSWRSGLGNHEIG